jgi:hypothetical protein
MNKYLYAKVVVTAIALTSALCGSIESPKQIKGEISALVDSIRPLEFNSETKQVIAVKYESIISAAYGDSEKALIKKSLLDAISIEIGVDELDASSSFSLSSFLIGGTVDRQKKTGVLTVDPFGASVKEYGPQNYLDELSQEEKKLCFLLNLVLLDNDPQIWSYFFHLDKNNMEVSKWDTIVVATYVQFGDLFKGVKLPMFAVFENMARSSNPVSRLIALHASKLYFDIASGDGLFLDQKSERQSLTNFLKLYVNDADFSTQVLFSNRLHEWHTPAALNLLKEFIVSDKLVLDSEFIMSLHLNLRSYYTNN